MKRFTLNQSTNRFHRSTVYPANQTDVQITTVGQTAKSTSKSKICLVCGDVSKSNHFGALCCCSCKAFFRRSVQNESYKGFHCPYNSNCDITILSRKCCQFCRFEKCVRIGMEISWVMSEEERLQLLKRYALFLLLFPFTSISRFIWKFTEIISVLKLVVHPFNSLICFSLTDCSRMLKKQKKEQEQATQPNSHSSSSKDSFMDSSSQNSDSHNADSKDGGFFADYSLIHSYLSGGEVHRTRSKI